MACQIETKRLRLKPLSPVHISDTYVDWLNDPSLMAFSQHAGRVHTQASCREYAATFDHINRCLWAIETMAGTHIGNINAYITPEHELADIGLLVGHLAGGKGYGLEAWQGVMVALFDHYGLRKVTGGCLASHQAMRNIMTRANMIPDGVRNSHFIHNGTAVNVVHMACFKQNHISAAGISVASAEVPEWD